MSFFEVMKRMLQGQPAFVDEEKDDRSDQPGHADELAQAGDGATEPREAIRKHDESSFPVAYVKRTKTNIRGDDMEVYCIIANTWPEKIMIDKIRIGSFVNELDDFLEGDEEQEFLVYKGDRFKREEFEAQLDYKTQNEGDYFRALHDVKYQYHDEDKTYSISEFRLRRPIIDIYG